MSELWMILFGSSGILKSKSKVSVFLKIGYLILIFPFIVFAGALALESGFGSGKESAGIIKKILVHITALFCGFCLWMIIITAILENLIK